MNLDWTSYQSQAQAIWALPNSHYALVMVAVAGVLLFFTGKKTEPQRDRQSQDRDMPRPGNTRLLRRLWWAIRPPHDTMRVDGLVIDRTRKPHAAWLGPTGAGKSSAVAAVRLDGRRPTLCVTPDISDPLRARADFVWTACESRVPVNFLIGSPTDVAATLTEVFRSGGVGAWKRTARMATADVIRQIDATSQPRTLHAIGLALHIATSHDRDLKTVCAGWVARFLDLADQFGDSIGPDGVDLAQLLREGRTVLLDNDSFEHAALGGDVVALGLAEAKRCANLVPGGFRLIFEEAGQLGERIDLAEPFFRAGRRRKIPVDALTQAESDLNEGINSNIATRVYFAQELQSLQKIAANRLGLDYRKLDPAAMRDFSAYISHGKIRRLVRFPKPSTRSTRTDPYIEPSRNPTPDPNRPRIIIREIGIDREDYPALPPPTVAIQELLARFDRSGHCHLWTGPKDKDGYGITDWNGKRSQRVHRIMWELTYGPIPIGPDGKSLDLDHQCRVRLCGRVTHLEPVTRAENVRRRWRVRGVGK